MNENLLSKLNERTPVGGHLASYKMNRLDELYHACLTLNHRFGDVDVDENASPIEIYSLMISFLARNGVSVSYEKTPHGLDLSFSYEFPIRSQFVDISELLFIKERDKELYWSLLGCVFLISQVCFNALYTFDMCQEYVGDCFLDEEFEDDGSEAFLESASVLHSDYMELTTKQVVRHLRKTLRSDSLSESLYYLINLVLSHYESWEFLLKAEPVSDPDDPNYEPSYIPFTEYTGFKFSDEYEIIEDYFHSHLQSFFEEGTISDTFNFEGDSVRNLYPLKKCCLTLYRAVDVVGNIIQEACHVT